MKANAPENLYIDFRDRAESTWRCAYTEKVKDNDIEYTRTDAFIEKVESFLNRKNDRDSYTIGYIKRHLKEIIKEVGL